MVETRGVKFQSLEAMFCNFYLCSGSKWLNVPPLQAVRFNRGLLMSKVINTGELKQRHVETLQDSGW